MIVKNIYRGRHALIYCLNKISKCTKHFSGAVMDNMHKEYKKYYAFTTNLRKKAVSC